jgi:glycosyltransferase involved in cell wall biosynthesis
VVSGLENFSEDVIADDVGWAFPVGDAAALARVLARLVHDPGLAASRRGRARSSYEKRYSPAVDLARLEDVYRSVTGAPPG